MAQTTTRPGEYFAAIRDPHVLANEMQNKIRIWREWCADSGLTALWTKKLTNYYGRSAGGNSSQSVTRGGAEGELSLLKVNDLHSLIQEQLVTVTSQRPAGIARAINSDTQSLKAARIGTAIAEYYMSQVGFEYKFVTATESALLCDEGFVDLFWDKDAGDPIAADPETGEAVMSGDCVLRTHSTWNVARDPGVSVDNNKWNILSYRVNKFDSAKKYDRFETQILACDDDGLPALPMENIPDGSDVIYAHLLVHDRTPAVPNGRYALMIGDEIVLDAVDDETGEPHLPFPEYPIERIAPSDVIDGCTGYAAANDIMGLEEVTDALHSIITTNQTTLGGATIVGPEGGNIKHTDLAKGLRYIEVAPDHVEKIKVLDLLRTSPEIFNYVGMLGSKKERAVGSVSSTLNAQAQQGASGNSMALIQSQSISFNSGTQRSYFKLLSGGMTKLVGILRVYADTPRVAKIVGKSKSAALKEFKYTGEDLNSISSIVYEMVNPIVQTQGGRLTFAQDLLKAGQIKSPKQYITVATTGQLDAMTEDDEADQLLILEENEWLSEGKPVKAIITQMHADHIRSHTSQITLEMIATDPEQVARILDHVQEHINLWMQASMTNPGILMATNQQPLMPPPGMMPPGPGGPPGAPQGPGQLVGDGSAPASQKAMEVKGPNLPNIAGTKDKPVIPGVTDQAV